MKKLTIFVGPVHAEKSTHAAQTARRLQRLGNLVKLLRPRCSVRPSVLDPSNGDRPGTLVTKNGVDFPSIEYDSLDEIIEVSAHADVVWFDELMLAAAQEPGKQVKAFKDIAKIRERSTILISALSATSEMEVFSDLMGRLLAVADEIVSCRADCDRCGKFAGATRSFFSDGSKTSKVQVGGEESYLALCPECWTLSTAEKSMELAL